MGCTCNRTCIFISCFKLLSDLFFREALKRSKTKHDLLFWNLNLEYPEILKQSGYKLRENPYFKGNWTYQEESTMNRQKKSCNSVFNNLAENFTHAAPMADLKIMKTLFFLRRRSQKLCKDTVRIKF